MVFWAGGGGEVHRWSSVGGGPDRRLDMAASCVDGGVPAHSYSVITIIIGTLFGLVRRGKAIHSGAVARPCGARRSTDLSGQECPVVEGGSELTAAHAGVSCCSM